MHLGFNLFVTKYLDAVRGQLRSYNQIAWRLGRISSYFEGLCVDELKRADIFAYIAKRRAAGLSNGSINLELATLSAALNYACKHWDWNISNPVTGQYLRWPEGRLRYLRVSEYQSLLAAASRPRYAVCLRDFIQLAVNTGCRKSELLTLRWRSASLEGARITIESEFSKSGRRRIVPLNHGALEALEVRRRFADSHCADTPWVFCRKDGERVRRVDKGFRLACKRAGIQDFRIHDLRHTFASWLVMRDVRLMQVRDLLGHSSIKMTERYAQLSQTELVRAVATLDNMI